MVFLWNDVIPDSFVPFQSVIFYAHPAALDARPKSQADEHSEEARFVIAQKPMAFCGLIELLPSTLGG
jgi:hypothetical protein